jgi:hypothetical protein
MEIRKDEAGRPIENELYQHIPGQIKATKRKNPNRKYVMRSPEVMLDLD